MYVSLSPIAPPLPKRLKPATRVETKAPETPSNSDSYQASKTQPPLVAPPLAPTTEKKAQAKPTVDIADVQQQLTRELPDVDVKFLNTDTFGELNGRLAKPEELEKMMESLKDESGIPFGYITDGCYARAHLMDESFRQHDINYAKMFVRGDLAAKNEHMEARWWYHVAPLVFVDDGEGNPVAKIIDPGFSDKPMDPEGWVKAMNQGDKISVDLVAPEQYYPRRGGKPDSFSESLRPAVRTMEDYSKELYNHKKARGLPVGDYQKPSWKDEGSGGDFVIDGVRHTIFPEGVKTSSGWFSTLSENNSGPLVQIENEVNDIPVSAAWENRPADIHS